jgi:cytosine deaminase
VLSVGYPRYNQSGTLLEGIAIWAERKPRLTKQLIRTKALEAVKWGIAQGCLRIRTHADAYVPDLMAVEALLELRDELAEEVDIQVVAFPQDGIYAAPPGEKLMEQALRLGADVVGGIPHNELTREDGIRDLEHVFALAEKHGKMVDARCDETGDEQSRFIEVLASSPSSVASRAGSPPATPRPCTTTTTARAELSVITNPFDNSVLQNRLDGYPRRRGHTRVDELLAGGVNVCIGHDSIMDPCTRWAKAAFGMITTNSARALGAGADYGIEVGKPADLVVLNADSEFDALRLPPECLWVLRRGRSSPARPRPAARSRSTGDPATAEPAPAVCNAIFDATGVRILDLPALPERVRNAVL